MSQLMQDLKQLEKECHKIADVRFFGDLEQKAIDLEDKLNDRHELFMTITTAKHDYDLTYKDWRQWKNPYIPLKELPFLYDIKTKRCKSFLEIFVGQMHSCAVAFNSDLKQTDGWTDETGTTDLILNGAAINSFEVEELRNNAGAGIIVGTGTTAIALADFALATKIATGTAATQLRYSGCHISSIKRIASETAYRIGKTFNNLSGGSITVEEVGLIMRANTSGGQRSFLHERTLNTNTILDKTHALYSYTMKTTL